MQTTSPYASFVLTFTNNFCIFTVLCKIITGVETVVKSTKLILDISRNEKVLLGLPAKRESVEARLCFVEPVSSPSRTFLYLYINRFLKRINKGGHVMPTTNTRNTTQPKLNIQRYLDNAQPDVLRGLQIVSANPEMHNFVVEQLRTFDGDNMDAILEQINLWEMK